MGAIRFHDSMNILILKRHQQLMYSVILARRFAASHSDSPNMGKKRAITDGQLHKRINGHFFSHPLKGGKP